MSDSYRQFINMFKTVAISKRLGYNEVAEIMNVCPNTVRNWWSLRSIMDGEAVLRCIQRIMGGYRWRDESAS